MGIFAGSATMFKTTVIDRKVEIRLTTPSLALGGSHHLDRDYLSLNLKVNNPWGMDPRIRPENQPPESERITECSAVLFNAVWLKYRRTAGSGVPSGFFFTAGGTSNEGYGDPFSHRGCLQQFIIRKPEPITPRTESSALIVFDQVANRFGPGEMHSDSILLLLLPASNGFRYRDRRGAITAELCVKINREIPRSSTAYSFEVKAEIGVVFTGGNYQNLDNRYSRVFDNAHWDVPEPRC